MNEIHLSIIIPAHNEERRLGATLAAIGRYLEEQDFAAEALVVDDGSGDGTVELAESFAERLPLRVIALEQNRGKGHAVRTGMLEARGAWRLFSDADLSTPIEELDKFWSVAKKGGEVVIGSRALPESDVTVHQSWLRELMGRTFNLILRTLGLSGIRDTQCGFKLFSAAAAEQIFAEVSVDGFAFDVEALMLARRHGFDIREVPVKWVNSPDSKVSIVGDPLRMFWDVLRLRLRLRRR
ncbi:dolichyl-phosphate beta-glucosyltransferase [Candidatus Sumerlaeota bacterium]